MTRFSRIQKLLSGCALLLAAVVAHAQDSVVGGDLMVARNGTVGATLLSGTSTTTRFNIILFNDPVFNVPGVINRQDFWGSTSVFNAGTPVGTTVQLALGTSGSDFPQGMPLMLQMESGVRAPGGVGRPEVAFSTASIFKDLLVRGDPLARVSYGSDNTAIVSFPSGGGAFDFSVRLMNVVSGRAGGGC